MISVGRIAPGVMPGPFDSEIRTRVFGWLRSTWRHVRAASRARSSHGPSVPGIHEQREHVLADAVQQIVLVPHVVVEGHRLDPELAADPPHGDGVQTLRVHDPERRLDDPVARELLPVFRSRCLFHEQVP